MKIKKGDNIKVIIGKYRGAKASIVEKVFTKENRILVKDVNIVVKHVKRESGQDGRVKVARPISISNVKLVCPKCEKTTRVGFKVEGGRKFRICKKCKEII